MSEEFQVTKSVIALCEELPDNNSFSFKLNNRQDLYFRLEDPKFNTDPEDLTHRSSVRCLRLDADSGLLYKSIVLIRITDTIHALKNEVFLATLKTNISKGTPKLIKNYALHGFTKKTLKVGRVS